MLRTLFPILGITFVDIIGFSMLIPMLPYFVIHFGASPLVVGLLFATFSLCQLVAGPAWGHLSDHIGRKRVLIISQVGATIGWLMLAFAPNIAWVFVARIVEGLSGGNIGITQAYVADLVEPAERSRAFGLIGATFAAAMIFGPLGGGILFAAYGFSVPFLVASGLQFLTLILTMLFLPESRPKRNESDAVDPKAILRTFVDPRFSRILAQKAALSLALYAWFAVFALYLQRQYGFDLLQTDRYFSLFAVTNVAVNVFLVGRISRRIGDRGMSFVGLIALVGAFALVPLAYSLVTLVAIMTLFSLGLGLANTAITAMISNAANAREQGTVLGTSSSLDAMAGVISPPLSTGLLGRFGSPFASLASLGFALTALALGSRTGKRPLEAPLEEAA